MKAFERLLGRAVDEATAGKPELSLRAARDALARARTKKERSVALMWLAHAERSPFTRYRVTRKLTELIPASPQAWSLHYSNAIDCGFMRVAAVANQRYEDAKKKWPNSREGMSHEESMTKLEERHPGVRAEVRRILQRGNHP